MVRGILKVASAFPEEGHNEHEIRRIQFAADTNLQRSYSDGKFLESRKLEEMLHYKLSYWTLRINDSERNQEYLTFQRKEVFT